jgi:multidrug efflux pump subunit AcrA (membrane-fusion protein)
MEDFNDKKTSNLIDDLHDNETILPSDVETISANKQEKKKLTTKGLKFFLNQLSVKMKIAFFDFLDLKYIDKKLPQSWQEKLPENRWLLTLPIVIFFIGMLLLFFLAVFAPQADKQKAKINLPVVRVISVEAGDIRIPVYSQGMVLPKNEIQLISVVRGPVIEVSPNMVDGGVVREGELLLKVSARPYEQDKAKAEANLQRAKAAQVARQSELRVRGTLRTPAGESQLREVNSAVAAAEADVEAMDDLIEQTAIKAPFTGVIRNTHIQKGQMINTGMPLASIYSTDKAVVQLPLSDRQLMLVDIPFQRIENTEINTSHSLERKSENADSSAVDQQAITKEDIFYPEVTFSGDFGDKSYTWKGRIIRSAGGRNELNRLQYVIAEIDDPFAIDPEQPGRPPLTPGFFIKAEIQGKLYRDLVKLPRKALKSNEQIWIVDNENRLLSKQLNLLYRGKDNIYVSSGLTGGEKVVVSDLEMFSEGLEVKSIPLEESKPNSENDSTQHSDKEMESVE